MGGKQILVTAGRGGVGASFVTLNLGLALVAGGARVLVVDGSPVCRTLDAPLQCEETVVYDLSDLCHGRVGVADACLSPAAGRGLALLPGVFSGADMPPCALLCAALGRAAAAFDFVLLDSPALPEVLAASAHFDLSLVVSDGSAAALRGAERVGHAIRTAGGQARLVLNRFSLRHVADSGQGKALSMLQAAHLPLFGILPPVGEDEFHAAQPLPALALLSGKKKEARAMRALQNMAARAAGGDAALLFGLHLSRARRKSLLY